MNVINACSLQVSAKSKYLGFVPARRVFHHGGGEVNLTNSDLKIVE